MGTREAHRHHEQTSWTGNIRLMLAAARLRERDGEAEGVAELERLAASHPARPEPWRTLAGHWSGRAAAAAYAEAYARSGAARDAWDAGRSIVDTEPDAAWNWWERIPDTRRGDFPGLCLRDARRALAAGSRDERPTPFHPLARARRIRFRRCLCQTGNRVVRRGSGHSADGRWTETSRMISAPDHSGPRFSENGRVPVCPSSH